MKTRVVKQFCCDFCGKRGLSASHMAKHERHCTMNPNRVCRMCKLLEEVQRPMAELMACVPQHPKAFWEQPYEEVTGYDPGKVLGPLADEVVSKLRELTDCPACIFAALRQSNVPPWRANNFDFKREMKSRMDDVNDEARPWSGE